jgi:hypothetical protein
MSGLQITASKTGLLLQCPRPFDPETETEVGDVGEAAVYGTRFHKGMAAILRGRLDDVCEDDELRAHIRRAHNELEAWMISIGNPFGFQFRVVEVEASRALDLTKSDGGIRPIVLRDPDGEHLYEDLSGNEMGGTCDALLEAETPIGIFRVVLDHKTGEHEQLYIHPTENEQMRALAAMWQADAVAILHTPRQSAPVVYAEVIETSRFRHELWRAKRMVGSGFLRTGSECRYCPARSSCPAKQGELIASTNALAVKTLGYGVDRSQLDKGKFHMLLTQLDTLKKMARNELAEDVRGGAIIERPDGKVLTLVTKNVERLSKKSIVEAYGRTRGEEVLQKLRDDGALTEVPQEELRAK